MFFFDYITSRVILPIPYPAAGRTFEPFFVDKIANLPMCFSQNGRIFGEYVC